MKKTIDKSVQLNLVGLDGNAFSLMGAFQAQARKEGWTNQEIEKVLKEAQSGDYDHLLLVLSSYCDPSEKQE
jgi:hypothetical protein